MSFLRRAVAVAARGLLGVAGLGVTLLLSPAAPPGVPELLPTALVVLSLVQPTVLVFVAAVVGAALAPSLGLRSRVAARAAGDQIDGSLAADARIAVPTGLAVGLVLVQLDFLYWTTVGGPTGDPVTLADVIASLPLRFLYGGLAEEVLLRWGLMTLFVWAGWRLTGRPETPSAGVGWGAIALAALLFGVGHLPAAATLGPLRPLFVVRTVGLNLVAGLLYGWLYLRESPEAAILGHAATHAHYCVRRFSRSSESADPVLQVRELPRIRDPREVACEDARPPLVVLRRVAGVVRGD